MSEKSQAPGTDEADAVSIQFPQANIEAIRLIQDVLGSTLGPRSMDKLVVKGKATSDGPDVTPTVQERTVSGDGATLLEVMDIEHPVGRLLERLVGPERPGETDVEGERIVDGITTRIVLLGELLDEATTLLEKGLHPRTVIQGYSYAESIAQRALLEQRRELGTDLDPGTFERAAARTAMTGNDVGGIADELARFALHSVDVVERPTEISFVVRTVQAGSIAHSRVVRGAILDRSERANERMPPRKSDATILVLDGSHRGGLQDRESTHSIRTDLQSADATDFETMRRKRKAGIVDRFADLGVDVVITRLGIDSTYQDLLADRGMIGIRGVTPLDIKQVAAATGASRVMDPTDVTEDDLGFAGSVEEVAIEPYSGRTKRRRMVVFDSCSDPESVAVLLRGVHGPLAEQATTAVRKAANAVATARGAGNVDAGLVPGGGGTHIAVSRAVREAARDVSSREQLAVEAYGDALQGVVATLGRNAGFDPIGIVADLTAAQASGNGTEALILPDGTIEDAWTAGVVDPYATVRDVYHGATAVATLVLRIDDAIDTVHEEEPPDPGDAIYEEPAERHQEWLKERDRV